jgi:4-amino-4-deoxy-L-arabinose transferase-like glycosyltransferase
VPLAALAAVALLWCIGLFARGYWTPDEPREAALAASMVAHLQSLPMLADQPFAEKPPLAYWFAGLSQRAFGAGPARARLPQFAYALLAFCAVFMLARGLVGAAHPAARSVAWTSALLFASAALACQVQVWLATDALLLAGVCVALAGMHAALAADGEDAPGRRARWRGYLAMHAGLTLAFFAKNFAGWLVPALAFLCFIAWEQRWRELRRPEPYLAGLLPAALIVAWVSAVAVRPDGAHVLRVLFLDNIVGRVLPLADAGGATYSDGHRNAPGKYLFELPAYLLPWTFVCIGALAAAWRAARGSAQAALRSAWRFALCAALPGLVVLSLAATARGIYAAPCMPGFALLAGLWCAEAAPSAAWRWALGATRVLVVLVVAAVIALTLALQWTTARAGAATLVASLAAGVCALVWALRARDLARLAASWCLLLSLGALALLGAVDRTQDLAALAKRVTHGAGAAPLLLWDPDETTLAWAQLYVPAGRWSAIDATHADAAGRLAWQLRAAPDTVVVSLVRGKGWSPVRWREYLRPRSIASVSVSMIPPSLAAREPLLAAARLSITARVERPGGRGYLLWKESP